MSNSANRRQEFEKKCIAHAIETGDGVGSLSDFCAANGYSFITLDFSLKWSPVNSDDTVISKSEQVLNWLKTDTNGGYMLVASQYIIFEVGEDASMFALTFNGTDPQ